MGSTARHLREKFQMVNRFFVTLQPYGVLIVMNLFFELISRSFILLKYNLNFCRLYPEDLKLSDMMASSAAVLSSNMGLYQVNMDAIRDIQIILGINMGRSLVAQSFNRHDSSCYVLSNYVSSIYHSFTKYDYYSPHKQIIFRDIFCCCTNSDAILNCKHIAMHSDLSWI